MPETQRSPKLDLDTKVRMLSPLVFSEAVANSPESVSLVTHTAMNREQTGNEVEFGRGLAGVIAKEGAYSGHGNDMYQRALSGKFKDPVEARWYEQLEGMVRKTLEGKPARPNRGEVMFIRRDRPIPSDWNMAQLEELPGDELHRAFRYRTRYPGLPR